MNVRPARRFAENAGFSGDLARPYARHGGCSWPLDHPKGDPMLNRRISPLSMPMLLSCLVMIGCDPAPEPQGEPTAAEPSDPASVDESVSAATDDVSIENSCRKPTQSCSSSQKCCSGSVCLNADLSPDPQGGPLTCHSCGKTNQVCCGTKRATSFKDLAKRCSSKNTVCPQSESSDICEPCGLLGHPCCIVNNKPNCRDGSTCAHSVPGGGGRDAGSGICIQ
jgi:hypothetical protein